MMETTKKRSKLKKNSNSQNRNGDITSRTSKTSTPFEILSIDLILHLLSFHSFNHEIFLHFTFNQTKTKIDCWNQGECVSINEYIKEMFGKFPKCDCTGTIFLIRNVIELMEISISSKYDYRERGKICIGKMIPKRCVKVGHIRVGGKEMDDGEDNDDDDDDIPYEKLKVMFDESCSFEGVPKSLECIGFRFERISQEKLLNGVLKSNVDGLIINSKLLAKVCENGKENMKKLIVKRKKMTVRFIDFKDLEWIFNDLLSLDNSQLKIVEFLMMERSNMLLSGELGRNFFNPLTGFNVNQTYYPVINYNKSKLIKIEQLFLTSQENSNQFFVINDGLLSNLKLLTNLFRLYISPSEYITLNGLIGLFDNNGSIREFFLGIEPEINDKFQNTVRAKKVKMRNNTLEKLVVYNLGPTEKIPLSLFEVFIKNLSKLNDLEILEKFPEDVQTYISISDVFSDMKKNTKLKRNHFKALYNLENLEKLTLWLYGEIEEEVLGEFSDNFNNLRSLSLHYKKLNETFDNFLNLKNLERLLLKKKNFSFENFKKIVKMKNLKYLYLKNSKGTHLKIVENIFKNIEVFEYFEHGQKMTFNRRDNHSLGSETLKLLKINIEDLNQQVDDDEWLCKVVKRWNISGPFNSKCNWKKYHKERDKNEKGIKGDCSACCIELYDCDMDFGGFHEGWKRNLKGFLSKRINFLNDVEKRKLIDSIYLQEILVSPPYYYQVAVAVYPICGNGKHIIIKLDQTTKRCSIDTILLKEKKDDNHGNIILYFNNEENDNCVMKKKTLLDMFYYLFGRKDINDENLLDFLALICYVCGFDTVYDVADDELETNKIELKSVRKQAIFEYNMFKNDKEALEALDRYDLYDEQPSFGYDDEDSEEEERRQGGCTIS